MLRDLLSKFIDLLVNALLALKSSLASRKKPDTNYEPPVFLLTYEEKKADEKQAKKFSKAHREFVGKPYTLQCSSCIFTEDEHRSLLRYGSWLSALASDRINPETAGQEEFTRMCKEVRGMDLKGMLTYYKNKLGELDTLRAVWLKYLCRIKFERDNPNLPKENVKVDWGWQGPPIHSGVHVFFSK